MANHREQDWRRVLQEALVIPLWPDWGQIMGFSRGCTYEMAQKGLIEGAFQTGRLWRIPTAVVRKQLKIAPVAEAANKIRAAAKAA